MVEPTTRPARVVNRLLGSVIVLWVCVLVGVSKPPPASAAPACEPRAEAHWSQHGGLKVDSAWHVAHGERPTCTEPSHTTIVRAPQEDNDTDRDRKSRYCRRHIVC